MKKKSDPKQAFALSHSQMEHSVCTEAESTGEPNGGVPMTACSDISGCLSSHS